MAVFQQVLRMHTAGHNDVIDITDQVARAVSESKVRCGIVNVAGIGSTLGITTIEYESGCVSDLQRALELVAPVNDDYAHHARWGDHNGYAHVRSALMGTAKTYPVVNGALRIGTWQQIVLCDFDDRARSRELVVTVTGE